MRGLLRILPGLALIALLVYWAGTTSFLRAVSTARVEYLVLAVLSYTGVLLMMSLRWRFLLSLLGTLPLARSLRAVLMGLAMGEFTPGRVGDAFRAYVAKRHGVGPLAATLPLWAVERLLDVAVVASAALLTSAFLVEALPARGLVPILAVPLLAAAALLALIFVLSRSPRIGEALFQLLLRPLRRTRFYEANQAGTFFDVGQRALRPRRLVPVIGLTALLWGFHILRYTLVARGLGAEVPLATMAFIVPASFLAAAVPLTVGGLGLLELGAASLLVGVAGLPPATAAAVPLLDRAMVSPLYVVSGLTLATWELGRPPWKESLKEEP